MSLQPVPVADSEAELPAAAPAAWVLPARIDIRSASLAVIALFVGVFALQWAAAVFIPLLLGVLLSYALTPMVDRLQRWRLPRALGAAAVLLSLVGGIGTMTYALSDDAAALAESLPEAAQKLSQAMRPARGAQPTAIDKVQIAAAQLEQATQDNGATAQLSARGVTRVQIERERLNIKEYLWTGTIGALSLLGQAAVVFFLAFFLLTSGDSFRRKLVKISGPTFAKRRITVQMLDEISGQVQRYLMIQVLTSVLVGLATWGMLSAFGMERAAVWGVVAAVLNLVPYLGAVVTAGGLALVAFLQFGTFGMAALIGGASMLINTLEGNLLTPWLTARASRMNPVVIFVAVLSFGWIWGIWGLLLGTPLVMVAKSICDHVDDLQPMGELLGE